MHPDSEGGCFAQEEARKIFGPVRLRQQSQDPTRAALFHLNRRAKGIERSGSKSRFHGRGNKLRRHVVEIGLDHDDLIPVACVARCFAEDRPKHIGTPRGVPGSGSVTDGPYT